MRTKRATWDVRSVLLLGFLGASACALESKEPASKVEVVLQRRNLVVQFADGPTAAEHRHIEELVSSTLKDGKLPAELARGKEHARVLLFLAAAEVEARVTVLALRALRDVYGPRDMPHKAAVNDAFIDVVVERLSTQDSTIQAAALTAARAALSQHQPNRRLIEAILLVGGSEKASPAARFATLQALGSAHYKAFDAAALEVVFSALQAAPTYVVSAALDALDTAAPAVTWTPERLAQVTVPLLQHSDPGIRGQVFSLLRRVDSRTATVEGAVLAGLADSHGFVRAEAAKTAGALRFSSTKSSLARLLDDRAGTRHAIDGFDAFDGTPGRITLGRGAGTQVRVLAYQALVELSRGALTPSRSSHAGDAELERSIAAAKVWATARGAAAPASP
jgi:hypothetical protein